MGIISDVAGIGMGLVQRGKANKLKQKADSINTPMEDPRMTAILDSVKRKASSISTGTDPLSNEMTKQAGENLATTQNTLSSVVGGDSGMLLSGLRKTQLDSTKALSSARTVAGEGEKYYTNLATTLADKISTRKFDLTMYNKIQKLRESAELMTTANANISGGIAGIGDSMDKAKDKAMSVLTGGLAGKSGSSGS